MVVALCLTPVALAAQANRSALPVVVVVTDTLRGPMANANVSVAGAQKALIHGVTDEHGRFVARIDVPGEYDVNVRRVGFVRTTRTSGSRAVIQ
ncbi:MAG TPA: carboxypeptidase-like regulatory domain-containing protein [Gemmatimonadaceae bacterium]